MIFLYETKKDGIISVYASVIEGQLNLIVNVKVGKRESQDIARVARVVLAHEGIYEDGATDLRNYK